MEDSSQIQSLWQRIKQLATLKFEYTRLTVAEKATILLSMVALAVIMFFAGAAVIFFLSVALSHLLAQSVGTVWSSVIVAGIYLFIVLVVFAFRKQLIINPISRFITRLILH
ncbi:MAG: hypothetical protein HDS53_06995 [Barnesiella sp.]|nr:hypothetical protein [Barnesiella sp.]